MKTKLFIDFDGTFNQVEALEALLEITIKSDNDRKPIKDKLVELTDLAMNGELDYKESITQRLRLINATKSDIYLLVEKLKTTISKSFIQHKDFLLKNKENIYIISNGFRDFIEPIIFDFGLLSDQVLANEFVYDENDKVIGLDLANPLSNEGGKAKVIKQLNLNGELVMIGDGFNDYQAKEKGAVDSFILYTENIRRESMVPLADHIANSITEVIEIITK